MFDESRGLVGDDVALNVVEPVLVHDVIYLVATRYLPYGRSPV
jgi:hypothetical protein